MVLRLEVSSRTPLRLTPSSRRGPRQPQLWQRSKWADRPLRLCLVLHQLVGGARADVAAMEVGERHARSGALRGSGLASACARTRVVAHRAVRLHFSAEQWGTVTNTHER